VRPRRPDVPSLVAGFALVALGVVLLLGHEGHLHMRFAAFAPIATAAVGATLVALGLSRRA